MLQTLVAEIYGPNESDRHALAGKVRDIFKSTPGVVDVDWYVEADQPKARFVIDKEKAALHGISAATISETLRIAVGGESVDLLHLPREKEDVNIKLELPRSSRTTPDELLALRVRSGDANALPEPGATGTAPLIPLRELVHIEQTTTEKSIYHKNLMPVTYVIGDVAGVIESPVYAILKMNKALAKLDTREFGGDGSPVQIFNAVQPFTESKPALKWDGEWQITIEVFRDLGSAFRRRARAHLCPDGRLVPQLHHPDCGHGGDPVFACRHSPRARSARRVLFRDFNDRLHGRRGNRGAQFHHPRRFHRAASRRRHATRRSRGRCRRSPLPADVLDRARGSGGRERHPRRSNFQRTRHRAHGRRNCLAPHQPHGRAGALFHGESFA